MIAEPGLQTSAPVVAFRAFRVRGGRLCTLTSWQRGDHQEWPVRGVVDARCDHPRRKRAVPHLAPNRDCRCGVYAASDLATLDRELRKFPFARVVVAAVQVWGAPGRPVIVGEVKGAPGLQFRAPHMSVMFLVDSRRARRVARKLELSTVPRATAEVVARERGGVQLRPQTQLGGRSVPRPGGWPLVGHIAWGALRGLGRIGLISLKTKWTYILAGLVAAALMYHAFPAFMGLLTAVVACVLMLIAVARHALFGGA